MAGRMHAAALAGGGGAGCGEEVNEVVEEEENYVNASRSFVSCAWAATHNKWLIFLSSGWLEKQGIRTQTCHVGFTTVSTSLFLLQ
jgi:hypothetical protein